MIQSDRASLALRRQRTEDDSAFAVAGVNKCIAGEKVRALKILPVDDRTGR
jgi:hypothetical protein